MDEKTKPLVPRLRFPEFREAGEWMTKYLANVSELIKNKAGKKKYTLMSVTAGVGLISQIEKFGREIAGAQYKNYFVIQKNDFAYNKSSTKDYPEGFIALYEGNTTAAVPNSIFTCFRVKENEILPKLLNYLFLNNLHGRWLRKFITIGARAHGSLNVDNKDLLSLPVPVPQGKSAMKEQKKIADCLSSLDALIVGQAEKIDALKIHKKGLMQQLFPREGETIPRLRFPEFWDSVEWEKKPISKIGEVVTGSTPSTTDKSHYGGDTMFVSPADISDQCFVTETVKTLTNKGLSKARIIPARSVLFVCIGSTIGKIAQNMYDCATNQQINAIIPFSQYVNDFVYYGLELTSEKIAELAGKQAVPIINKTLFSTVPLSVAPDKDEQQKIADCLSSLDALIAAQEEKINALKAHKKGLMQQLFPTPEEVV
uniref:restriction endonuclease subunit S n=1 Tax=Candidatus Electrothrix sp. TaxID=2170559 RepID=UPI004057A7C9